MRGGFSGGSADMIRYVLFFNRPLGKSNFYRKNIDEYFLLLLCGSSNVVCFHGDLNCNDGAKLFLRRVDLISLLLL